MKLMKRLPQLLLLTLVLTAAILWISTPQAEASTVDSGTCGDNLSWTLDDAGTLTITGTGAMTNFECGGAPWYNNRSSIIKVVIDSNVTTIGDCAFYNCSSLTDLLIPDGVESIGQYAFGGCSCLASVVTPSSTCNIGAFAFENCTSLKSATFRGYTLGYQDHLNYKACYGYSILAGCSSLEYLYIRDVEFNAHVTEIYNYPNYYPIGYIFGIRSYSGSVACSQQYYAGDRAERLKETFYFPASLTSIHIGGFNFEGYTGSGYTNAFSGCTTIREVIIEDGIQSIPSSAFYNLLSLESVVIPSSVTTVANSAFYKCDNLTDVYYNGMQAQWDEISIESYNEPLTNATINTLVASGTCGDNLTWTLDDAGTLTISGTGAMYDYSWRTSPWYNEKGTIIKLVIEDGVATLGNFAFNDCSNLCSMTIPGSVTTIGMSAFSECVSLTSVAIPYGVVTIGDNAFSYCERLSVVTISGSVSNIGEYAFAGCSLAEVTIPDGITTISTAMFSGCSNLTSVTIPCGVTIIGDTAFAGCGLTSVVIPDSVITIADYAFANCTSLVDVEMPKSVTSIGEYAFQVCSNLTVVRISESVVTIGESAFRDCNNLTDVYYTGTQAKWNSITIGDYNESLTNAALHAAFVASGTCGDNLTWTLDDAGTLTITGTGTMHDYESEGAPWFSECDSIKKAVIESGVITIGDCAFQCCTNLTDILIPAGVTTIGYRAFADTGPTSVTIPAGVTHIGNSAFYSCTALLEVTIPDSVTTIGASAFEWCYSLTSVTIPAGVTTIGAGAFENCSALIWISPNNTHYSSDENGVLFNKDKTELLAFPISVSGEYTVPDGVAVIRDRAFFGCYRLTAVTIPNSVINIDEDAFFECTSLTDVYYTGTQEQWDAIAIGDYNESLNNAVIHVVEATPQLTGIFVSAMPNKTVYISGEALDTTGLTLTLMYDDGSYQTTAEGFAVTGFNTEIAGVQNLTVTYEGLTTTFAVAVQKSKELEISGQPASAEITAGFTAQFTVEATNVVSYKWQYRRNENAPWGNTTLTDYATDTLSVPAILSRNGYQYRCRITGTDGKVLYTEPATLTVLDSIAVTSQPTRQIVNVDANATFTVQAEGAGLTYQWLYRKSDDDFWKQTGMVGNKTNTLTVPALLARNGYQYMCAITDENGIKIHSKVAELSAIGFTAQPEDQNVSVNTNGVFSVAAKGQNLTYQWQYRKTETGSWMSTTLTGFDTDTLTVLATSGRNGYQYRCRITDELGIIRYSDPATLTVETP